MNEYEVFFFFRFDESTSNKWKINNQSKHGQVRYLIFKILIDISLSTFRWHTSSERARSLAQRGIDTQKNNFFLLLLLVVVFR